MESYFSNLDEYLEVDKKVVLLKWFCKEHSISLQFGKDLFLKYGSHTPNVFCTYSIVGYKLKNGIKVLHLSLSSCSNSSEFATVLSAEPFALHPQKIQNPMLFLGLDDFSVSKSVLLPQVCVSGIPKVVDIRKDSSPEKIATLSQTETKQAHKLATASPTKTVDVAAMQPTKKSKSEQKSTSIDKMLKQPTRDNSKIDNKLKQNISKSSPVKKPEVDSNYVSQNSDSNHSEKHTLVELNVGEEIPAKKIKQSRETSKIKVNKNRRRVIIDSDDSEEENSPILNTPVVPDSPAKDDKKDVMKKDFVETKHKSKRKVLKTVTSLDDKGFMVTEKKWVYESCSEDECEDTQKSVPNTSSESAKRLSPLKKTQVKQSSLMSFFSKK